MESTRRSFLASAAAGSLAFTALNGMPLPANAQTVTPEDAQKIAEDTYIYGYSLITTDVTRVQMTNVPAVTELKAPMNSFFNIKRYPPGDYRGVSAPNADTLYSIAWLDLGAEPIVFSHPDMGKRYYLFPTYSLWMPVIKSLGSRTTGEKAANYLFTGPGWNGQVPAGMTQIKSPTRYTLILGRTYADGSEADYQAVNALQAQYKVVPLSEWGKPYTYKAPPVDPKPGFSMTDKPQSVILAMDTAEYFNRMATLMGSDAPPAKEDAPIVEKMAKIGIIPGKPFDMSKLDPAVQAALKDLPQRALKKIEANKDSLGKVVDGWIISMVGEYGTDYMKRAVVAAFGWPANLKADAVYPYTEADSTGARLTGVNKYALTFAKDQTPPVDGFWSITMYEIDAGWWFVPNPLNKFTVSMRNNPKFNDDGSLTLYFQNTSPGADKEANWLPAPKGEFIPMLRMYWPKEDSPSILNGSWKPPAVRKVS
jgi:hypothetical protein